MSTKRILLWVGIGVFAAFVIPLMLRLFALSLKGEFDPEVTKNRIDSRTCEFVLTPDRGTSFLKCPIPEDYKIPNWPTKPAPLNQESK